MSIHLELGEFIENRFGNRLASAPELRQDALLIALDNGVRMEVRFATPAEYAISWLWGDAELRVDTAPLHPMLGTSPNHLHDAAGEIRADSLTRPGAAPRENLERVIEAVLADPLVRPACGRTRVP